MICNLWILLILDVKVLHNYIYCLHYSTEPQNLIPLKDLKLLEEETNIIMHVNVIVISDNYVVYILVTETQNLNKYKLESVITT